MFDGIQGFYNEDYFNRMLSLERKRTQRSKKPFMLMVIDISKLVNPHPNLVVINSIGRVLEAGIRETDVRGWYRKGQSIGVIFTELESACAAVRDKIFGKLLLSLAGEIDPKDLEKIDVSFHIFPEDQDKGNCSGHFNMNLYKDLLEGEKKTRRLPEDEATHGHRGQPAGPRHLLAHHPGRRRRREVHLRRPRTVSPGTNRTVG